MTSQTSGTGREPARSCVECGTRAEPGQSFCDSCGAVLGWAGSPDRSAAAPVPAAASGNAGGTGTARTGQDAPAAARAATGAPAGGRPAGDEPHRRDGHTGGTGGPVGGGRPEQDPASRPHADTDAGAGTGAGTGAASGAGSAAGAGSAQGSGGTRQPEAAPAQAAAPLAYPEPAGFGSTPLSPSPSPSPSAAPSSAASGAGTSGAGTPGAGAPAAGTAGAAAGAAPAGPGADVFSALSPRTAAGDDDFPPDADTEPRVALGHPGGPHHPATPASASADERARSLLIPVNDPEPRAAVAPAVAPVLPGRPVANRPQVRAPGPESGPENGPPCPWCGTPNRPDRHFCGRCAMPMAGGPRPPERRTWWRRLLDFRTAETPWAGDRPRLRRGFGRLMNWVVGALVLGLIITLVVNIGDGVDATRDHFAKRAPVGPDSVRASRSYPGHSPQLAFDGLSNTWWGPGVSQSGEGEWVEARFDNPTRLLDVVITSGVSAKVEHLQESALPNRIEAQITTADGKKSTRIINLDRSAGGQRRKFRVGAVVAVRFTLRSAYAADAKKQVSIAEIELFTRSNGSRS
ncbi:zinc ribbon domain-containing protein [Streptomyces sp. NPDC002701]|uniref:zinc ribbon domain-containing protein n=1 Tax=Streptomyces sp. NPDC002701 TaxID=3364661 RepID=UPI0036744964